MHSRDRKCEWRFSNSRRSTVLTRESTSGSVETLVEGAKYKLAWLEVDRGAACNAVALVLSLTVFLFLRLCPMLCTCVSLPASFPLSLSSGPSPSCAFFPNVRGGAVIDWMSASRTLGSVRGKLQSHASLARCHYKPSLPLAPTPSKN